MTSKTYSACIYGVNGVLVEVEADASNGLPGLELTGNLSTIVKESKERVRLAIRNSGVELKPARYVVNFAPARLRKEGAHFDLAIAISILKATGITNAELDRTVLIGELALDGRILGVKGVLPMIDMAKRLGFKSCIVPSVNLGEGRLIEDIEVLGVDSLRECIDYLEGRATPKKEIKEIVNANTAYPYDYGDIMGQNVLKRGMLIAAAAMHNILMVGPPGAGKTMSAMRINTILPSLSKEQIIDVSRIYSVAGLLMDRGAYIDRRPFRNPNYTITAAAMAGGGYVPMPGEISLASEGVLFLDELNLYKPEVLETLRIPMETGVVSINRHNATYSYPANFMLIGAINPCRCGYYPDRERCNCSERDVRQHFGRISRPILDRIDICIQAQKVQYEDMEGNRIHSGYTSADMHKIVLKVQEIQNNRFSNYNFKFNSRIPINKIKDFCPMEDDARLLTKSIYDKYNLTARSYHKLIRVARTIADIEGHDRLMLSDIAEAVGYRLPDMSQASYYNMPEVQYNE